MALPFNPVNLGDPAHGGALRPSRKLTTLSNWKRDMTPDFRAVIDGINEPASVAAIFDNQESAEKFLKAVVEADLGLSVNISTSIEGAKNVAVMPASHVIASDIRWGLRVQRKNCPTRKCSS